MNRMAQQLQAMRDIIGLPLLDMHGHSNSMAYAKDELADLGLELISEVPVPFDDFHEFIDKEIRAVTGNSWRVYSNKWLVVIGHDYDYNLHRRVLIVAYSYDGRRGGIGRVGFIGEGK